MNEQFQNLHTESFCDNVLLEHRLALELKEIDYIKFVFPIMIGEELKNDDGEANGIYSLYRANYNESKCYVTSVEQALNSHLNDLGLGSSLKVNPSVCDIENEIKACNGYFIGGKLENTFESAVRGIVSTLKADSGKSSVKVLRNTINENKGREFVPIDEYESVIEQLKTEKTIAVDQLNSVVDQLKLEIERLKKFES